MKKLILLLTVGTLLASCEKENNGGRLDPNATVALNPAPGTKTDTPENPQHMTARQIIEQADALISSIGITGIADWNRDLERNRIVMSSTWVIRQNGDLEVYSLQDRNQILVTLDNQNHPIDTIAYIPNSVMQSLEQQITAAYNAEDYATCYRLFEDGFVFTPITGAEWLELKAQGNN